MKALIPGDMVLAWLHFVAIGIISIGPTRAFLRWRRAEHVPADAVRSVARIVAIELALLALVPLAAVLLARGVGA